jgi:hypothetical protein
MNDLVVTEATLLPNVDEADYHASRVRTPGPQVSQSGLKMLRPPSTPREFQHRLVTPQEPKRAFDVGHAAHSLVLGVGAEFVRHPDELLTSNGAMGIKTESKQWVVACRDEGKIPLKGEDYDAVYRMAESILAHRRAAELVTDPDRKPEVSAYCEITEGLWLRSRFDLLGGGLTDFKTAADPHPDAFRASAWKWGYHVQDVAYRRAYALITGETPGPMTFVIVGKEAPHLVSIATLDPEFERLGNEQLDAAIAVYLEQLAKHGAPDAEGVVWDGLPEETAVLSPPRSAYYDAEGVDYIPDF